MLGPRKQKYNPASFARLKQDPLRYEKWKQKMREVNHRSYRRRKLARQMQEQHQQENPMAKSPHSV
jgi:hypothetical protein